MEETRGGAAKGGGEPTVDERYMQWKSLIPVLYDLLAHHNLVWPSLSCRWGSQIEQATYKNHQRLYLSEQTDGTVPNTLVVANCEVVKPRVAAAGHISQVGKNGEHSVKTPNSPAGLFFQHAGHRDEVADFHWNASDPWTIASVSDDCERTGGGGILQVSGGSFGGGSVITELFSTIIRQGILLVLKQVNAKLC